MKKLINKIVLELASLGLTPHVLQELLAHNEAVDGKGKGKQQEELLESHTVLPEGYRVVYEVNEESNRIEPCLRFTVDVSEAEGNTAHDANESEAPSKRSLLWALQRRRAPERCVFLASPTA